MRASQVFAGLTALLLPCAAMSQDAFRPANYHAKLGDPWTSADKQSPPGVETDVEFTPPRNGKVTPAASISKPATRPVIQTVGHAETIVTPHRPQYLPDSPTPIATTPEYRPASIGAPRSTPTVNTAGPNLSWLDRSRYGDVTGCDPGMGLWGRDSNSMAWIVAEYLLWRTSGMDLPALVTTSPLGTASNQVGVLGNDSTRVLIGNESILSEMRSAIRVRSGFWFEPSQSLGLEVGFFTLFTSEAKYNLSSAGEPNFARPFFNTQTNAREASLLSFATENSDGTRSNDVVAQLGIRATTNLWGLDANFRQGFLRNDTTRVDLLLGYRHLRLHDTLDIGSRSIVVSSQSATNIPFGTQIITRDEVHSGSEFHGVMLGLSGDYRMGAWSLGATGKLGLGENINIVNFNGRTIIAVPNSQTRRQDGGLYAQTSNIGRHRETAFSIVPELGLNVGYDVTRHVRIFAGYSAMYWTNVTRAGDQIDLTINGNQIPQVNGTQSTAGAARPAVLFRESNLWLHGINFGLEFRW